MTDESDPTRIVRPSTADEKTRIVNPAPSGTADEATRVVSPAAPGIAGEESSAAPATAPSAAGEETKIAVPSNPATAAVGSGTGPSTTRDEGTPIGVQVWAQYGAELVPGQRFGGFTVDAEIGHGAMGVVYRVTRLSLQRTEALKVIGSELAADAAYRERFKREASNAAAVDHPHIVRVYDADERDGRLYMAMQYIDGDDLGARIASEGPPHPAAAAEITRQIASALDAAHARGLIHRDVKPGNILLARADSGADHAYLSDFGVSRRTAGSSDLTQTGAFVGTPHYTAPEQHLGKRVDHRADVYALGCVLFEMLTGRKPYPETSSTAVAIAHCEKPPPSPRAVDPRVPAAFDAVVAKAMAKNAADRYQTASELGAAAARAAATVGSDTRRYRRPRRTTLLAAVGLLTLLAGAAAAVIATSAGSARHRHGTVPARHHHPTQAASRPWPRYQGSLYSAQYPPGWRIAEDNVAVAGGAYFETRFTNVPGTAVVLIDRTPGDPDTPEQAAASVESAARAEPGYQLISSSPTTLAGQPAWQWELSLPASGSLPIAGDRVDVFRKINGDRFATLGVGGASLSAMLATTRRVAASIEAR